MSEFINIHSNKARPDSIYSVDTFLRNTPPIESYYSLGLHPWNSDRMNWELFYSNYRQYLHLEKCLFIGETGLDFFSEIDRSTQEDIFRKHIELASLLKKPLLIHCVKAYNEVKRILRESSFKQKVIFHNYNGNTQQTEDFLKDSNIYFSFGENLFRHNSGAQKSSYLVPTSRIFFETDESNLEIKEVYHFFSTVTKTPLKELCDSVYSNYRCLFIQEAKS